MTDIPFACFALKWLWVLAVPGAIAHWLFIYMYQWLGEDGPWDRRAFKTHLTIFELRFLAPMLVVGAGVMSGSLKSSFAFLDIFSKNPYVYMFWLLAWSEEIIEFYWYVFADSRGTRERYWRIYSKPMKSENLEKLYRTAILVAVAAAPFVASALKIAPEFANPPCP
jgi:hypothetical protein